MYKYIIIISMLLVLSLAWAQSPVSLRHYSMGTVMDGEWDHIYDPIELNFYDQMYFYTNLSDYTQHITLYDGDAQAKENSRFLSEYPFGYTFGCPFNKAIKHSLLVRFKDSQMSNMINGYGETERDYTDYFDTNGDLIYDLKQYTITKEKDYTDMGNRFYLLLNTTVPMYENVFGFRLIYDHDCQQFDEAMMDVDPTGFSPYLDGFSVGEHSKYQYFSSYDLDDDIMTLEYDENGDFDTTTSTNKLEGLFSYMMPADILGGNSEVRFDLNLNYENDNRNETNDKYNAEYYRMYDVNTTGTGTFEQTYDRLWSMPKSEIFGGVKLRKNLDDVRPRYKQSFWELGFGLGGFGGPYTDKTKTVVSTNSTYIDTTMIDMQVWETEDSMEKTENSGSFMGFHTNLNGRSGIFFSENVCFGYGFSLDLQTYQRKTDNKYDYNSVSYSQLGTAFDDIDDSRVTRNSSYKYKQELAQTTLQTNLPVGLEFSLPKYSLTDYDNFSLRNFSFRIGTTFMHTLEVKDFRNKLDEVELYNIITEDGAGNVNEMNPDSYTIINSHDKNKMSNGFKRFTAGIGYEHSDYLNIDVGGYVDSRGEDYFIGAMFTVKK